MKKNINNYKETGCALTLIFMFTAYLASIVSLFTPLGTVLCLLYRAPGFSYSNFDAVALDTLLLGLCVFFGAKAVKYLSILIASYFHN